MGCQDQYLPGIQQVDVVVSGVSVPITFPTTTVAKTQTANGTVVLVANTDLIVSPTSTTRRFVQITNISGSVIYVALGAAATSGKQPIPNNYTYTIDVNTIGEINQQDVHLLSVAGAATGVTVYSE